ncbi:methionyl-tRNA synthetase [Meredithblackwellia eburnea MCA 4105]
MASPFPAVPSTSNTRKIRQTSTLVDFRKEHSHGKILPKKGERNVLITSALPYVNNQPHLGNIIGSTLSADVFARYARQRNNRVLYVCGTDEYGTTTEVMAAKEGVGPKELCDKYHKLHAEAYEWFQIGFDHFGRTSTEKQTEICQHIFLKLYQNGWMEEHENKQLYCETDQRFLADRYVEGTCPKCGYEGARGDQCEHCSVTYESPLDLLRPKCSACGSTPTERLTAHLHIKLASLQPQIETWVKETQEKGTWSANGKAFTNGWLKGGLQSRGMTRDLEWGVRLPKELGEKWEKKVMYVWFDAPIGYPSITANYTDDWELWWKNPEDITLYQFMGKDNVPFHTVLFPAYLIGTHEPWTMLNSISTTEYLQYEGTKFSKSKNVGVFGQNARSTGVQASVWRYYLLQNRPETSDSEFTWDDFVAKNNGELLNNLGNFVNRIIKFVIAKFDSVLPDPSGGKVAWEKEEGARAFAEEDQTFVAEIDALLKAFINDMDHQKIRAGIAGAMAISARGNQYIQDNKVDNALLASNPLRTAQVVLTTINLVYLLSSILHPFMPSTSDEIIAQLDATPIAIPDRFEINLLPGHKVGSATHLFTKIDPKKIDEWRAEFGGAEARAKLEAAKALAAGTGGGAAGDQQPLSRKQQDKLKKAARLEAEAKAALVPKTPEQVELEERIKVQGEVVRKLKTGTEEGDVEGELAKLQALKADLKEITAKLAASTVTEGNVPTPP